MSMIPRLATPITASPPALPGNRFPRAGSAPSARWARTYLKRNKSNCQKKPKVQKARKRPEPKPRALFPSTPSVLFAVCSFPARVGGSCDNHRAGNQTPPACPAALPHRSRGFLPDSGGAFRPLGNGPLAGLWVLTLRRAGTPTSAPVPAPARPASRCGGESVPPPSGPAPPRAG